MKRATITAKEPFIFSTNDTMTELSSIGKIPITKKAIVAIPTISNLRNLNSADTQSPLIGIAQSVLINCYPLRHLARKCS